MPTNNTTKGDFKSPNLSRRITTSSERRKRHPVFTYTICLILAALSSCFPWSKTFKEKDVLVKYGTDDTGIASLLNINGYYEPCDSTNGGKRVIFYTDGTMRHLSNINGSNNIYLGDGVYKVSKDTLVAESFYYIGMSGGRHLIHLKFKIIDRNHIDLISVNDHLDGELINVINHYQFVPFDSLPLPITYMKQKRWMWNDKTKWKSYMQQGHRRKYWE